MFVTKLVAGFVLALAIVTTSATAADVRIGDLKIEQFWTRATPGGAKVAVGYLTITNVGTEPDVLVSGTFEKSARVEVHEMKVENDIMRMREMADGLEIKPGETVTLKPGGSHLMFMGLSERLREGETVTGTVTFRRAGTVKLQFPVRSIAAPSSGHDDHSSNGDHGAHNHEGHSQ